MTTVAVSVKNPAFVIDSDFIKVEQVTVTVLSAATLLPDAGRSLYWVVRRSIDRDPGPAFVVSGRDEGIPHALESS